MSDVNAAGSAPGTDQATVLRLIQAAKSAGAAGHGGRIECRAQKPARDCNERSLLRRFGAGIAYPSGGAQ